jgi:alpha-beta hydrolase superfamily lysophospholipase
LERYFEINQRGHNIRCKLYCTDPQDIRKIVVFGHGFGGHKDNGAAAAFARRMLSKYKGTAMVTFNWPAHGDDVKKKICLADCSDYLQLVVAHLKEKYGTEELYCYATSFGGYLTLKYISEQGNPFRKIALRCPAVNMYQVLTRTIMASGELEDLRKGREIPVGFDRKILVTPRFLQELEENDICRRDYLEFAEEILILHGTEDEIVPFEAARTFCDEQCIEFIPIEGADHRFRSQQSMDQAIKEILEFFRNP